MALFSWLSYNSENIFPKVPKVFFFFCEVIFVSVPSLDRPGDVGSRKQLLRENYKRGGVRTDAAKTYDDVVP